MDYVLDGQYARLLRNAGIDPSRLLRAAGLPGDALVGPRPVLAPAQHNALIEALSRLAGGAKGAIALATGEGVERFSPPVLAAYCADDALQCLERLARYKPLIGPVRFTVEREASAVGVVITAEGNASPVPAFQVLVETAFLLGIIRSATGEPVNALAATMVEPPRGEDLAEMEEYLGCPLRAGAVDRLVLRAADAALPFTTSHRSMWEYLEPELSRRLADLHSGASTAQRVRACLVELLPSGRCAAGDAARRLGVSRRTLQRRLGQEGTTFSKELASLRHDLALGYLSHAEMGVREVAYLLGYLETNSFLRAFRTWTGTGVGQWRAAHGSGGGAPA